MSEEIYIWVYNGRYKHPMLVCNDQGEVAPVSQVEPYDESDVEFWVSSYAAENYPGAIYYFAPRE